MRRKRLPAAKVAAGNAVFLVGFMGAGKSSVGLALGQRLNWIFEDLDDRIELREQRSVAEIFRNSGEEAFRGAEHAALKQVLEDLRGGAAMMRVIALGGGAFAQPAIVALLKSAGVPTVFLDAPVGELWKRCCTQASTSGKERPLLKSQEQFEKLYNARRRHYAKAQLKISTSGRSSEAIAAEIEKKLKLKKIAIRTEEGDVE